MTTSVAHLTTERASIYLQQLCKHFAHNRPVEFSANEGRIDFSDGTCRLAADGDRLTLRAQAEGADRLARVEDVVARHIVRFAFREPLSIHWRPAE